TASAGIAGGVEMLMLRAALNRRVGRTGLPAGYVARLWSAALGAAAVAWLIRLTTPPLHPVVTGLIVLVPYGVASFLIAWVLRVADASAAFQRVLARRRGE